MKGSGVRGQRSGQRHRVSVASLCAFVPLCLCASVPLCLCAFRGRRGLSLLEVLISMGVLSVGLLGFALLIPVGRLSIVEAGKCDRAGACGRAGLREVKVRRMLSVLDNNNNPTLGSITLGATEANDFWTAVDTSLTNVPPFAIDPLGVANGLTGALGGVVPRCTMSNLVFRGNGTLQSRYERKTTAEQIFLWQDDKSFDLPGVDVPGDATQRAQGRFMHSLTNPDGSVSMIMDGDPTNSGNPQKSPGSPAFEGNYSWLLTVVPAAAEATLPLAQKTRFTVSVAVCYKRNFVDGEQWSKNQNQNIPPFPGGVWTGGVQLETPLVDLKANQWIMLCATTPNPPNSPIVTALQWYRVVSANIADDGTHWLTLAGPDWVASYNANDPTTYPTAVVITSGQGALGGVIGVYTTTIDVGRDVVW